jgi:hypothetical protein
MNVNEKLRLERLSAFYKPGDNESESFMTEQVLYR